MTVVPAASPSLPASSHALTLLVYCENNAETLAASLRQVCHAARRCNVPVIAVDNASWDGSAALLAAEDRVRTLFLDQPASPGEALNRGLRLCSGHVLLVRAKSLPESVIADSECWLEHLLDEAERHPEAGLMAARTVTADGRILADGHTLLTGLGLHHPGYLRRHLESDSGVAASIEVDSADLDVALLKQDMLAAVAALRPDGAIFDPVYDPAGLMDDDLSFAARTSGFSIRVTGRVKAVSLAPAPPPEGAQLPVLTAELERKVTLRQLQAEYWAHKWGWDPLLPDMSKLRRLYGHTQVGWRTGAVLRWEPPTSCPAVDLCMVTWNGEAHLERCLLSLAATRYPADRLTLYLVDNASTDGTASLLERLLPQLPFATRLQRLAVNVGGVAGMNWAMAEGSGQLVAKLDDDIIVPPDWLEQLVAVFVQRPYAAVVGPRIVDDTDVGRIQCADYSCHPVPVTHEQEADEGQTSTLARVTHVRGCCNLYRRDAITRCGPLDIRFSPSQWDDPEHQLAMLTAGYEILHEGRVAVAHKMTTGSVSSGLSLANAALNKAKMLVKWGQSASELLECALLLSEEGRYVGTDHDPGLSAPAATLRPAAVEPELVQHLRQQTAPYRSSPETVQALRRLLRGQAMQIRQQAVECRQKGLEAHVLPQLRAAVSCAPHDPLLLRALADALDDNGATLQARNLRRRAEALGPASSAGRALPLAPTDSSRPRALTAPATSTLRAQALWCLPYSQRLNNPLLERLQREARPLEALGWRITLDCAPCPRFDAAPYACVHFWTLSESHETLAQIKAVANLRPDIPRLLTPLQDAPLERCWLTLVEAHFKRQGAMDDLPPWPPEDSPFLCDSLFRRQALALAQLVLPRDDQEASLLSLPPASPGWRPVQSRALELPLPPPDPRLFREASGLNEFVLAVAPVEPAAGQAQLLAALASLQLPVVLVGDAPEAWYLHLCRRLLPSCLFVSEAEPALLASAFAAARVHALPSLLSRGEASARYAALAGTPVVLSRNSAEHKALSAANALVQPCDPWSVLSIATAVSTAWATGKDSQHAGNLHFPQGQNDYRLANNLTSVYAEFGKH